MILARSYGSMVTVDVFEFPHLMAISSAILSSMVTVDVFELVV